MASNIDAVIQALVRQYDPPLLNEGNEKQVRQSRMGELFTANWKTSLLLAGRLWGITVGTITAGGDVAPVTGGGAGTTVDQDQPEVVIGVDAGYYLVPVSVRVSAHVDIDADADDGDIIVAVDRSAAVPTSVTGTIETPANQLDGGPAFPGRAFSAVTADITDPTVDEILDSEHIQGGQSGNGAYTTVLKMNYEPEVPDLIAGPCGLYVYWGGVAAVKAIANIVVAAIPDTWVKPT
jgi:hypothetical protein